MSSIPRYLIVGGGRAARHIDHYFNLLKLPHEHWKASRELTPRFLESARSATHILLLVSDQAVASVGAQIRTGLADLGVQTPGQLIHFSGALSIEGIAGAHPLFPFTHDLYTRETYERIPFVLENRKETFRENSEANLKELLPGLPNPACRIDPEKKALYHALCVASGNFTTLLWQTVFRRFESALELQPEILFPYLSQITVNLENNWKGALTGPLTRGDHPTLQSHLQSLEGDPLQKIYQQFVEFHFAENAETTKVRGLSQENSHAHCP
ncbi:MAG: DUF2520 domain-containing protein [Methylotenera sp.]|nr:DUF2520 domain-containing protein [Oligoflexia bacterium]